MAQCGACDLGLHKPWSCLAAAPPAIVFNVGSREDPDFVMPWDDEYVGRHRKAE